MEILAIGLGDWVDEYELRALASDNYKAKLKLIQKYSMLADFVQEFKETLCNGKLT